MSNTQFEAMDPFHKRDLAYQVRSSVLGMMMSLEDDWPNVVTTYYISRLGFLRRYELKDEVLELVRTRLALRNSLDEYLSNLREFESEPALRSEAMHRTLAQLAREINIAGYDEIISQRIKEIDMRIESMTLQ